MESYHSVSFQDDLLVPAWLTLHDRVSGRPLQPWIVKLRDTLLFFAQKPLLENDIIAINELFRDAILILLALDNLQDARMLCQAFIHLVVQWYEQTQSKQLLKFILDAWIELIRLDRHANLFEAAYCKLQLLEGKKSNLRMLSRERINMEDELVLALANDTKLSQELTWQCLLEKTKLYFSAEQYQKVLDLLNQDEFSEHAFCIEVKVSALAYLEQTIQALSLCLSKKNSADIWLQHVLMLKMCQLLIRQSADITHMLQKLINFIYRYFELGHAYPNIIAFSLQVISLASRVGWTNQANHLLRQSLAACEYVQNELLKTECLIRMYQYADTAVMKHDLESAMISFYFKTQYPTARIKLQTSLPELKYVECQSVLCIMRELYDDLLEFSCKKIDQSLCVARLKNRSA